MLFLRKMIGGLNIGPKEVFTVKNTEERLIGEQQRSALRDPSIFWL